MIRKRTQFASACGLLIVVTAGLTSCGSTSKSNESAPSGTVALDPAGAPTKAALGVVVSLTSAPGQGADWSRAAEGAAVAAERFRLGGHDITLVAQNDKGTAEGAQAAVDALIKQRVSGIVMATEGSHLTRALQTAVAADIPVVLPYAATDEPQDGAWSTAPDSDQVGAVLAARLEAQGLRNPIVVQAGGEVPSEIATAASLTYRPGSDPARLAASVAKRARKGARVDSVVVTGSAEAEAKVVSALQGNDTPLPILLTPQALSPQFAVSLEDSGGSTDASLATVGTSGGDTSALEPGTAGTASATFYAALRLVAGDRAQKDFFDGLPFSAVAYAADARSHDAVVALVSAMAVARSTEAVDVGEALSGLALTSTDGLAGPDLDFGNTPVISSKDVTALQSTSQDPGVRPTSATTPQIFWFAPPTS